MVKVLPPILNPFLYWLVAMIFETTQVSAAPNPARGPVSGWIQPIEMLPPLALLALVVVLALEPLTPELHASSSPPPPTTAAPTPAMRSRPRLLTLSA